MDTSIKADSQAVQPSVPEVSNLRLWPALLILAIQLVTLVLTVTPANSTLARFGFMMLGPAVCFLLFSIC